ncbi:MAG: ABC transporter substrate-binding protein, partial [Actinomycetota bacterium]
MKRRLFAAARVLIALALIAVVSVTASGLPVLAQTPNKLKKLNVVIPGFESNLTPFTITFGSTPNTHDLLNLVYDTLFWSQSRLSPEPWLAEKASPSPDRKVWTVKLRSGVKWHDGKPFTAEDVKFTFDYFKTHAADSGRYGHHLTDFPAYDRAQVVGPTELKLHFLRPAPSFTIVPGADLPILPQHIWEKVNEPTGASGPPIGTGPYKVRRIIPNQGYVLTANGNYFKSKPLIDEINISVNPEAAASFNDLIAGKVDFVARTVPADMVDPLTQNSALKVVKSSREESVQLNFNVRKARLSDPRLRKAISLAIDNQVLVKSVLGGRGRPGVDGFIHPESPWAMPNGKHEFDPARANQLLDSAGFTRKDGDGVRKGPDGKRLEFVALVSNREPENLKALQIIAQMTTGIGVRIVPRAAAPLQLRLLRRPPPGQIPPYDMYVSGLEVHTHADPDALNYLFRSPGPPGSPQGIGPLITGYSNAQFDQLADQALTATDANARKQTLYQMQTIFGQEAPSIALYYPDGIYSFRPSAYDGWIPDPGQGIFTKRSFLKGYARTAALPGEDEAGAIAPAWLFLAGVAGMILIGSGIVLIRLRVKKRRQAEPVAPEPVAPEPVAPEPVAPEPVAPEPVAPAAWDPELESG